jgi:hypothetical protein
MKNNPNKRRYYMKNGHVRKPGSRCLIWVRSKAVKEKLFRLSRMMAKEKRINRIMLADAVELAIDEALDLRDPK